MKLKTPYKYLLTTTICLITCRLGAIDLTSAQNYVQEGNKNFGEQKWEAAIESYQAALQYAPSAWKHLRLPQKAGLRALLFSQSKTVPSKVEGAQPMHSTITHRLPHITQTCTPLVPAYL